MERVTSLTRLPARDRDGHKGRYGKILILAKQGSVTKFYSLKIE